MFMPGPNTPLNSPDDSSCFESETPKSAADKREVPPLFLSPKEEREADDHEPPGLNNPFWR